MTEASAPARPVQRGRGGPPPHGDPPMPVSAAAGSRRGGAVRGGQFWGDAVEFARDPRQLEDGQFGHAAGEQKAAIRLNDDARAVGRDAIGIGRVGKGQRGGAFEDVAESG